MEDDKKYKTGILIKNYHDFLNKGQTVDLEEFNNGYKIIGYRIRPHGYGDGLWYLISSDYIQKSDETYDLATNKKIDCGTY